MLGLPATGTRVSVHLRALERSRPSDFEMPKMRRLIENSVGLRLMLTDAARELTFSYDGGEPEPLTFEYPGHETPGETARCRHRGIPEEPSGPDW